MSVQVVKEKEIKHQQFGAAKIKLVYNAPVEDADFEKIFGSPEKARKDHSRRLAAAAFNSTNSAATPDKLAAITTQEAWNKLVNETLPRIAAGYTPQLGDGVTGAEAKDIVSTLRSTIADKKAADLTQEDIEAMLAALRV